MTARFLLLVLTGFSLLNSSDAQVPFFAVQPHSNPVSSGACGISSVMHIIGGVDATPGAWSWQVQILLGSSQQFICGGSLITPRWVVTAAHCISRKRPASDYTVRLGDHNRDIGEGTEQKIPAIRTIVHPRYGNTPINNDIALIELASRATLGDRVGIVCLPRQGQQVTREDNCYMTGWGKIEHPGPVHVILQQANIPPISNNECSKKIASGFQPGFPIVLTPEMLCAGQPDSIKGGCHGDSGGPYVCQNVIGRWVLQGTVSWGSFNCNATQMYTVFARVAKFRNWIDQYISESSSSPAPSTPKPPTPVPSSLPPKPSKPPTPPLVPSSLPPKPSKPPTPPPVTSSMPPTPVPSSLPSKPSKPPTPPPVPSSLPPKPSKPPTPPPFPSSLPPKPPTPPPVPSSLPPKPSKPPTPPPVTSSMPPTPVPSSLPPKPSKPPTPPPVPSSLPPKPSKPLTPPPVTSSMPPTTVPSSLPPKPSKPPTPPPVPSSLPSKSPTPPPVTSSLPPKPSKPPTPPLVPSSLPPKPSKPPTPPPVPSSFPSKLPTTPPGQSSLPPKPSTPSGPSSFPPVHPSLPGTTIRPYVHQSGCFCNFDRSVCNYFQSIKDSFDWCRGKGLTSPPGMGPYRDHTTGKGSYMYIKAELPRRVGDTATLWTMESLSGTTCLTFYYHMHGTGVGTLAVIVGGKPVFVKKGNQGFVWRKAGVVLNNKGPTTLEFTGIIGTKLDREIAIDDVSLQQCFRPGVTSGPVPSLPPTPNPQPTFPPKLSTHSTMLPHPTTLYPPIPTTLPAPPSPSTSPQPSLPGLQCNFDKGLYGWRQIGMFNWTLWSGATPTAGTGPSSDHTSGKGNYIYIETSYPRIANDNSMLLSMNYVKGPICMTFFYHMWGRTIGTLNVYNSLNIKVFSKSGNQGNRWKKASVELKYAVMVVFEGVRGSSYTGDIALDDITTQPGLCPVYSSPPPSSGRTTNPSSPPLPTPPLPTPPPKPQNCNFDNGLCGWEQSKSDKFDWSIKSGKTSSQGTGPPSDHTTGKGKYIYIETSHPRVTNDNAILVSRDTVQGPVCLTFFYHMWGRTIGTLIVYDGNTKVFSKYGNQGNSWKIAFVTLKGGHKTRFEGVRGPSYTGDIALDDITIKPGLCLVYSSPPPNTGQPTTSPPPPTPPPKPQHCNFDNGLCGWEQSKSDKFDWSIKSGKTSSQGTGPPSDHTTGKGKYIYIETSNPRVTNDNAILVSRDNVKGPVCMTFFYHMWGRTIGTLIVYDGNTKVFSKYGNQGNSWKIAFVTLKGGHKVRFEGVRGKSYTGDIAIDDVAFVTGTCLGSPPPASYPPTLTPTGSSGKQCGVQPTMRIVGGVQASPGRWPWQAMLRTTGGFQFCGGSLVDTKWVVTAAHCVQSKTPAQLRIRLGAFSKKKLSGFEQDFLVEKIITHPMYHKPKLYSNDIAMVKLQTPAKLTNMVGMVCVDGRYPLPLDHISKECWITGWGTLSSGGSRPDVLMQASVPLKSKARCSVAYPNKIGDSMLCAGLDQGGIDSCQGDSGGPLVCQNKGRWYLEGVTSWGYGCAVPRKYGVYAKIRTLYSWVSTTMRSN